ncbi:MAG: DUF2490 domain-containing protein [Bacteroidota bacterium]
MNFLLNFVKANLGKGFLWGLFFLISFRQLEAQSIPLPHREQVDQVHAWYVWTGQYPIRGKWGLYTEYHFRRANLLTEFQQSLLRVGAEYKLSPQVSGIMGYGLIHTGIYGEQPLTHPLLEHRIWQQLLWKYPNRFVNVSQRLRMEERFISKLENGASTPTPVEYRIRYRLQLERNFGWGTWLNRQRNFWCLSNEVFANLGPEAGLNRLDQNRFYLGYGHRFGMEWQVQAGYLRQLVVKKSAYEEEDNHTLMVMVSHSLAASPKR